MVQPEIQTADSLPSLAGAKPIPTPRQIRQELLDRVIRDLHGPLHGEDEELDGRYTHPRDYILGSLAPANTLLDAAEGDDFGSDGGDDEDAADAGSEGEGKPRLRPSSIGLTFIVPEEIREIAVTARWGRYDRLTSETLTNEDGSPRKTWHRTPMGGEARRLLLREWEPESDDDFLLQPEPQVAPNVVVTGRVRRRDGSWFVTLFLKNAQEPQDGANQYSRWLYQAELEVAAVDGAAVFEARRDGVRLDGDAEDREAAMLYRDVHEFAAGHGCAVAADPDPARPGRAFRIRTVSVPCYELPRTDAPGPEEYPLLAGVEFDMKALAAIPDGGFGAALSPLVRAYRAWIATREKEIPTLGVHQPAAMEAMARARHAADRIEAGISLLDHDPQAARAFRFANSAMHQQRVRSEMIRNQTSFEVEDAPKNRSWRPFQLAFILINLPSLTNLDDPDRSTDPEAAADLLWFPTGGGKTEAYLGLTAYTIAIRRLQGIVAGRDGRYGVAVIMRYTLRLLTLQQFQRATALMCACEVERRKDPATWGEEPIRIGLWVGGRMTPNKVSGAEKAVRNAKADGYAKVDGDPYQLTSCPWCGTPIERGKHLEVSPFDRGTGRTYIRCGDALGCCPFGGRQSGGEGLPVLVVDEEIYRHPPALLIATVDKFAQMPWKGAVQNLFGHVTHRCQRHGFIAVGIDDAPSHRASGRLPAARTVPVPALRPPDLIIQDELHLISGPLGTLVGLYETAVDELATWEVDGRPVRPKVIASTATIRRAPDQVRKLFARGVNVFPPNGLDTKDNFFSLQREPSDETPGRFYVGIAARGARMKQVLIRLYAAILAAAQQLADEYGEAVDPYMTLVGYFGSLRELGGMRRLVDDDIASRAFRMDRRGLARRLAPYVEELTSRRKSADIPNVLARLGTRWTPLAERADGRGARRPGQDRAIDVLLATNMISVGVDVPRLGLMVVNGQPKNTAEYIQATSRVGRDKRGPGLVFTVFQWTRPRDISHYEHFEHSHATLYQQVEPLSVTPFASRALQRGLSSVLVSMVRLAGPDFAGNAQAREVTKDAPLVQRARAALLRRGESATVGRFDPNELIEELELRLEEWRRRATLPSVHLVYEADLKGGTGSEIGLLHKPEERDWETFTALQSLRDVEPGIGLILKEYTMDDEHAPPVRLTEQAKVTENDEDERVADEVKA